MNPRLTMNLHDTTSLSVVGLDLLGAGVVGVLRPLMRKGCSFELSALLVLVFDTVQHYRIIIYIIIYISMLS